MAKSSNPFNLTHSLNSWVYFLFFFVALTLLSYFSLPLQSQLWIGLFGLILPFSFACRKPIDPSTKPFYLQDSLKVFPLWIWILLLAAVFIRLYRLTTISTWPMPDEGVYSF